LILVLVYVRCELNFYVSCELFVDSVDGIRSGCVLLFLALECSDLFNFLTDDEWIIFPNLFSTQLAIIEGTIMGVTVAVQPTKHFSTTALEPYTQTAIKF
jgi:hypothetical protein